MDGEETTFTREDVARYLGTNHGTSGLRSFGSVHGDWRMIERIANDAQAHFDGLAARIRAFHQEAI